MKKLMGIMTAALIAGSITTLAFATPNSMAEDIKVEKSTMVSVDSETVNNRSIKPPLEIENGRAMQRQKIVDNKQLKIIPNDGVIYSVISKNPKDSNELYSITLKK